MPDVLFLIFTVICYFHPVLYITLTLRSTAYVDRKNVDSVLHSTITRANNPIRSTIQSDMSLFLGTQSIDAPGYLDTLKSLKGDIHDRPPLGCNVLSQPSVNRGKSFLLDGLDSGINVASSSAEVRAVETIADGNGLTFGALNIESVSGDGSFSPRVTLTVGEEETLDFDVPAEVILVDLLGLGDSGLGERLGEHERALTLKRDVRSNLKEKRNE